MTTTAPSGIRLQPDDIHKLAKARVGFRIHLMVYVAVNAFLAALWWLASGAGFPTLAAGEDHYWPVWTHLGWGLGLVIHGFVVYGGGANWVREEEARIRRKYE